MVCSGLEIWFAVPGQAVHVLSSGNQHRVVRWTVGADCAKPEGGAFVSNKLVFALDVVCMARLVCIPVFRGTAMTVAAVASHRLINAAQIVQVESAAKAGQAHVLFGDLPGKWNYFRVHRNSRVCAEEL